MKSLMVNSLVGTRLILPVFAASTADPAHAKAGFTPWDQDTMTLYLNRNFYKFPDIQ